MLGHRSVDYPDSRPPWPAPRVDGLAKEEIGPLTGQAELDGLGRQAIFAGVVEQIGEDGGQQQWIGRAEQNDPRPHHEALRRAVLAHDGLETAAGFVGQVNGGSNTAGHGERADISDIEHGHHVGVYTSQTVSGFPLCSHSAALANPHQTDGFRL